jgi:hypothetical protein
VVASIVATATAIRTITRSGWARTIPAVFTIEQRDDLAADVLRLAHDDDRVVGGAVVGSLAVGTGDAFSDLDLTFGVADDVLVTDVLSDQRLDPDTNRRLRRGAAC